MEDWSVERVVDEYELEPHPEGGYYRETWRSEYELDGDALAEHPGPRPVGTSILYLLPAGAVSNWHRMVSEEIWLFHAGNPVELSIRPDRESAPRTTTMGHGSVLQSLIPRNWWQRAESRDGAADWSLVACVVVPGFDFEDFEMIED